MDQPKFDNDKNHGRKIEFNVENYKPSDQVEKLSEDLQSFTTPYRKVISDLEYLLIKKPANLENVTDKAILGLSLLIHNIGEFPKIYTGAQAIWGDYYKNVYLIIKRLSLNYPIKELKENISKCENVIKLMETYRSKSLVNLEYFNFVINVLEDVKIILEEHLPKDKL